MRRLMLAVLAISLFSIVTLAQSSSPATGSPRFVPVKHHAHHAQHHHAHHVSKHSHHHSV